MQVDEADEVREFGTLQRRLVEVSEQLQRAADAEARHREAADAAYRELSSSYTSMVRTLAEVCEAKDHYTRSHLDRTYHDAMLLTGRLAPHLARRAEIGYGFLLHDIGKVGIPESVLNEVAPLTDGEWAVMRTHPLLGVRLVEPLRFLGDAVGIIRSHHERWDGRGYPEGLRGEEIVLPARIFMLADTFDAMTTDRPYRRAMPIHRALEELDRHAGTQFDPEVARAWIGLVEDAEREGPGLAGLA